MLPAPFFLEVGYVANAYYRIVFFGIDNNTYCYCL